MPLGLWLWLWLRLRLRFWLWLCISVLLIAGQTRASGERDEGPDEGPDEAVWTYTPSIGLQYGGLVACSVHVKPPAFSQAILRLPLAVAAPQADPQLAREIFQTRELYDRFRRLLLVRAAEPDRRIAELQRIDMRLREELRRLRAAGKTRAADHVAASLLPHRISVTTRDGQIVEHDVRRAVLYQDESGAVFPSFELLDTVAYRLAQAENWPASLVHEPATFLTLVAGYVGMRARQRPGPSPRPAAGPGRPREVDQRILRLAVGRGASLRILRTVCVGWRELVSEAMVLELDDRAQMLRAVARLDPFAACMLRTGESGFASKMALARPEYFTRLFRPDEGLHGFMARLQGLLPPGPLAGPGLGLVVSGLDMHLRWLLFAYPLPDPGALADALEGLAQAKAKAEAEAEGSSPDNPMQVLQGMLDFNVLLQRAIDKGE